MNLKKLVSAALTATTVLWMVGAAVLPVAANAQSTSSIQTQLAALLAEINQLQAQLGTSSQTTTTTSASNYQFNNDLTVGSTGADVDALQSLLISKGYLTAVSAPTGYFGTLTQTAVAKWQAANGIKPAAGYFGPISRAFVNSMNVSTTTTTTGNYPAGCTSSAGFSPTTGVSCSSTTTTTTTTTTTGTTVTGVTAPATGLQVSFANDNPPSGSLITSAQGTSGNGAARVPVLSVYFTAGNSGPATVSSISFHKTGVLADSSVAGAYLIQNGQVVAQYNSINSGVISFSGLNWQIPAGTTQEVTLAIDVAGGLSAGNTTAFSLNSASDVTAFDANNNAITPSGAFPLAGNIFTVTSVSNPSLATLTVTSSSVGTAVTAGTQGNIVGAWNFVGGNNTLWLKSIAFHVIGSANMTNLQNVKLLINGTQAGATLASVGTNGIAYFNLASAPAVLNTGSNNVQIQADVTGSPSYNFQWEVLNGYDIDAVDSQYNVPVSVALTSGADAVVTIQAGQTTTSQDTSTPTGNIAKGVSGVTLAKFDVYAAGEPTKVKFLDFSIVFTGLNVSSDTSLASVIKNVNITDDAGQQVGTTINTPPSGTTCAATDAGLLSGQTYTSGGTWSSLASGTVSYYDCFGTSGSPINYVIPANTTRVLSLKADIQPTANFQTITANLLSEAGNSNLQGQISSQSANSSGASGSALTLSNSSLTVTQNTSLGTQTLSKNSSGQEIGSYALTASTAEGVNVSTISITLPNTGGLAPYLQNLKLFVNGVQFGTTQPTVAQGTYTFSGNQFNVPAGGTVDVNVVADINSGATGASIGGVTALSGLSGSGAISNSAISLSSSVAGQNITIAGGSTITITTNQGSNPTAGPVAMGTTGNALAAFNFQETSNIENVKVTQLNVVDVLTSSTITGSNATNTAYVLPSFSNLTLWNGATQVGGTAQYLGTSTVAGGANAFVYQFSFGNNSSFVIPRNGTLPLTLKGNVNALTQGGVTDASIHTFEIATSTLAGNTTATTTVIALGQTSNQSTNVVLSGASGNQQTVFRNAMTFSSSQVGLTSGRSKSASDQLATLTFTPNNNGSIALNTVQVTFTGSAMTSTTSTDYSFASSTYLVVGQNGSFGTQYTPSSTLCNGGTQSCVVTFSWPASISGFQVNGSPTTFTLVANTSQNTTVAGSNNSVSLFATIAASSSIQYTDGTDATSTTVSGINLPNSVLTPLQIFGAQYATNS